MGVMPMLGDAAGRTKEGGAGEGKGGDGVVMDAYR